MEQARTRSQADFVTLRDLREGDRARIEAVRGEGAFKRRLLEMGFLPGTTVEVKKYAPLRDPIEVVIKGYHVSLRRQEAQHVLVRSMRTPAADFATPDEET